MLQTVKTMLQTVKTVEDCKVEPDSEDSLDCQYSSRLTRELHKVKTTADTCQLLRQLQIDAHHCPRLSSETVS